MMEPSQQSLIDPFTSMDNIKSTCGAVMMKTFDGEHHKGGNAIFQTGQTIDSRHSMAASLQPRVNSSMGLRNAMASGGLGN